MKRRRIRSRATYGPKVKHESDLSENLAYGRSQVLRQDIWEEPSQRAISGSKMIDRKNLAND